jgi:hypothetical protein
MIRRGFWFILVALIAIILGAAYWVWNYDDEKGSKEVWGVCLPKSNEINQFELSNEHRSTNRDFIPFTFESFPFSEKL